MVDITNAEHYKWAEVCDGWFLLKDERLSIIQERIPPGGREVRHFHEQMQQFFYVLEGELTIEHGGETSVLRRRQGLPMPVRVPHLVKNESAADVHFLVISEPNDRADRVRVEG